MWIGVTVALQPRCSYCSVLSSYWVLSGGIFVPRAADGWNRKARGQYVVSVRRRRWVRGFWSIEMGGLGHGPVGIASERAVWDVFEGFW